MASESKKPAAVAADIDGSTLTLTFANGDILRVYADTLTQAMRDAAIMHGLKQKLVDAAAIARNPDTGASATIADKYNAVREIFDRITSPEGTWNKIRGDGTGSNTGGLLLRAMAALTGRSLEETQGILDALSDDEVKALRASPKVQVKMADFRKPKATNVDVDALMSKFGI